MNTDLGRSYTLVSDMLKPQSSLWEINKMRANPKYIPWWAKQQNYPHFVVFDKYSGTCQRHLAHTSDLRISYHYYHWIQKLTYPIKSCNLKKLKFWLSLQTHLQQSFVFIENFRRFGKQTKKHKSLELFLVKMLMSIFLIEFKIIWRTIKLFFWSARSCNPYITPRISQINMHLKSCCRHVKHD